MTRTYTVADAFAITFGLAKSVRVHYYQRKDGCRRPTLRHMWDDGTFWSWLIAWRTNPPGTQPCGCTFEYGEIP